MVQDAPLSGVTLSVPFLVRLAREVPLVRYFKIEVPGAAAKLRGLIEAGGAAIAGPFDGEESITLMADLDAGATGTMPSALLPDLIRPVRRASPRRPAHRGGRGVRAHPAAHQFREPAMRPARDARPSWWKAASSRATPCAIRWRAASGDARRTARARARARAARAALGQIGGTLRAAAPLTRDRMETGMRLIVALAAALLPSFAAFAATPIFPSSAGDTQSRNRGRRPGASLVARLSARRPHAGDRAARPAAHRHARRPIVGRRSPACPRSTRRARPG